MKKKLLAVVLSVVMLASLLVPMIAINAATPTGTIGLGQVTTGTVGGEACLVIPVELTANTGELFTGRYQVWSEDGLTAKNFKNGDIKYETEDEFGDPVTIALNYTKKIREDYVQIVFDSNGGTAGLLNATGNVGYVYFVAPTTPGTYTFKLVWMDGTDNAPVQYEMATNPETVTYTVECTNHNPGAPVVTTPATCTTGGEETVSCTICGKPMSTNPIAALGHNMVDDPENTYAPNCTEAGQTAQKCDRDDCDYTVKTPVAALGHEWDNGTVDTNVQCGETADVTFTCTRDDCDETKVETGALVEHDMVDDPENTFAANCTTAGQTAQKCNREGCDHTVVTPVAALGHSLESNQAAGYAPNCTEQGLVVDECVREDCDYVVETPIPALGHDFNGEVTVTKKPTLDETGTKSTACTRDDCTETEDSEIAKLVTKIEEGKESVECENGLPEDFHFVEGVEPADLEENDELLASFVANSGIIDLAGNITYNLSIGNLAEKYNNFRVYVVDAQGNTTVVEGATLTEDIITFTVDADANFAIVANEIPKGADGDTANAVIFAVVALAAVAGLVVVGKKRFAL